MNIRTPLIRAALATALVGAAFTLIHTSPIVPADAAISMSVDARAPLHATLLPVVSVFADATAPDGRVAMRIAATDALPVTLLPTVHVNARVEDFSATPTRVAIATRHAQTDGTTQANIDANRSGALGRIEVTRVELADAAPPALRTHLLPR